jgi:lipoprotein-releasing system ATP-binding protein
MSSGEVPVMLAVRDVTKSYATPDGPLHVLRGISLEAAEGEMVALVGPSGVGKSTLLHLVAGLDRPDGGGIEVGGEDVTALKGPALDRFRRRMVGVVYQFHFLLPEFTALENVMLPAVIAGSGASARARAMQLLEEVGVAARASHTPAKLSGGEQQRVAIARALMNGPRVLLADEPTGNLDEETAAHAFDLLLGLQATHRLTLLMATHNMALAGACNRTIRLREGRVG